MVLAVYHSNRGQAMYEQTNVWQTQTTVTNESFWVQLANLLRGVGQIFVIVGRVLVRIGEVIYQALFQ